MKKSNRVSVDTGAGVTMRKIARNSLPMKSEKAARLADNWLAKLLAECDQDLAEIISGLRSADDDIELARILSAIDEEAFGKAGTSPAPSKSCALPFRSRGATATKKRASAVRLNRVSVDTLRLGVKAPVALFTGQEAARALKVTQPRFARAIRSGRIRPDFIANAADLFLPATVQRIAKAHLFKTL